MDQKITTENLGLQDSALACGDSLQTPSKCEDLRLLIERLTAAQLDVLKLVALRRTSKEIARELGISPVTVDQRIKRAQAILGAASRSEAARMLIAARGAPDPTAPASYGKTIYDSSGLSESNLTRELDASFGEWNPVNDSDAMSMRQTQAAYSADVAGGANERPWSLVLEDIRRSGKLSHATKTAIIAAITIFTVIVFAMLISLAEGISRII